MMGFDYFNERYNMDNEHFISSSEIKDIKKVDIKAKEIEFSAVVVFGDEPYVFLDEEARWKMCQEIAYEQRNTGPIKQMWNRAKKESGAERIVWIQLFYSTLKLCNVSFYPMFEAYNLEDDFAYLAENICTWVTSGLEYNEFYRNMIKLLPGNIEQAKQEQLEKELRWVSNEFGNQFENADKFFDKYEKTFTFDNLPDKLQNTMDEICKWRKLLGFTSSIDTISQIKQYLEILENKKQSYGEKLCQELDEELKENYGSIVEKKVELLESTKDKGFEEALNLYRYYQATYRELERQKEKFVNLELLWKIDEYIEFYKLGSIYISDYLNKINKNSDKKKVIEQTLLDKAVIYFFETEDIGSAKKLQEKEEYLENKKGGVLGEKTVEYALKWLDASYMPIHRSSQGKYGEETLILYNPQFIDEEQEYDHIIIGPQGVFNIETKNYSGELIIDENGNWIRLKNGEREGERNPIQQVRRHEKLLRSIIGKEIPIINVICISHPKSIITGVENCSVPVLKSDLLVEYIENYKGEKELNEAEIKDIAMKIQQKVVE